jgi:hypothetical protein
MYCIKLALLLYVVGFNGLKAYKRANGQEIYLLDY